MTELHLVTDNRSEPRVTLAHGNGGRHMRTLIEDVFARHLANPLLDIQADAVTLPDHHDGELVFTSDGVTVQPLFFPGGDIGSLAVHGSVNDLAVSGATPRYLSINTFLEEGLPLAQLERIVASLAQTARECGVQVVAGDTKVVPHGQGGGIYFGVSALGIKPRGLQLGCARIQAGDAILVSGPVGDHGIAVMLAREQFGIKGDLRSDSASVLPLTQSLLDIPGLRFMRDPTRGGLATVLCEIQRATGLGITVKESHIPIRPAVQSVCDMLGYDPLYLACEGRVVAVIDAARADDALARWRALPGGAEAQRIGRIDGNVDRVLLVSDWGGERVLQELEDDPLPRIC